MTEPHAYGMRAALLGTALTDCPTRSIGVDQMVKPEWGTKRTCPKCSTRFYDLGNEEPVHCINCGTDWIPEPVLKSKQPLAFEAAAAPVQKEPAEDEDLAAEELTIDEDEEVSADEEVDLNTGDEDLGVETAGEDDET